MTEYYDLRDANRRVDAFTKQLYEIPSTLENVRIQIDVLKSTRFLTERRQEIVVSTVSSFVLLNV